MFSRLRRPLTAHRTARLAALLAVLLLAAPATAQNPDLTATFLGSSPKVSFAFKWKDEKHTRNVGLLSWDIPLSEISKLVATSRWESPTCCAFVRSTLMCR